MKEKLIKISIFLYYLVNERFMLLNTSIESIKHTHVKGKYTINKNIKNNRNIQIWDINFF